MAAILRQAHEESPEVDCIYWPCQQTRSIHHHDSPILDTRGKAKEGAPEDHVAVDDREGNGPHSSHIKGLVAVDVEGLCFLPQT